MSEHPSEPMLLIDNVVTAATKRPRIGLVFDGMSREDWQVMGDYEKSVFFFRLILCVGYVTRGVASLNHCLSFHV